jgi:hypothetical protein
VKPEDKFVDLYWIVQRQHIVHEGSTVCPASSKKCYTSSKRRPAGADAYDIDLDIDVLSARDIEEPIALVKDFQASML